MDKVTGATGAVRDAIGRIADWLVRAGWAARDRENREEVLSSAAYDLLGRPSAPSATFPKSDRTLDELARWVAAKREWSLGLDSELRDAVEGWLWWVEHGIEENREENRTHAAAKRSKGFWDEHRRVAELGRAELVARGLRR